MYYINIVENSTDVKPVKLCDCQDNLSEELVVENILTSYQDHPNIKN